MQNFSAASLKPDMVYLREDGAQMLVLESGENVPSQGAPAVTYFITARCLSDWETTDVFHAASKGTTFKVVDAKDAVYTACTDLNRMIRERQAVLDALSPDDAVARKPAEDLAAHKATLQEVEQVAKRLGVRCRGL